MGSGEGQGRYLEEGMLEAVLLAPSTALGHEVVRPPAAEKEKVKPCSEAGSPTLVLVPLDKLALFSANRLYLGDSAQSGTPSQRGQFPQQGVIIWDHGQNVGAWETLHFHELLTEI